MKRISAWGIGIALFVLFLDWGFIGLQILDHDYEFLPELYLALACCAALVVFGVLRVYALRSEKCPHCGKALLVKAKYCPHCGKEISDNSFLGKKASR